MAPVAHWLELRLDELLLTRRSEPASRRVLKAARRLRIVTRTAALTTAMAKIRTPMTTWWLATSTAPRSVPMATMSH